MFEVRIKVLGSNVLTDLERKIKGLPSYISSFAFENIHSVLKKFERATVRGIIYGPSGVTKRTGNLGKAFHTYVNRVNQYSFAVEGKFDESLPYLSTQVGIGSQYIIPKKAKKLWIPIPGGPADVYPRRPVSAFYSAHKGHLNEVYYFANSAAVPRRVNPYDIEQSLVNTVNYELPKILGRAVKNWKSVNGY